MYSLLMALLGRDGCLPLAEGQRVILMVGVRRQTSEHTSRVDAGRQQEYQWGFVTRIVQGTLQIHHRRFDKLGTELFGNENRYRKRQSVQSQAPDEQHLLKRVTLFVPRIYRKSTLLIIIRADTRIV